jgi:hypothetical protein
MVSHYMRRKLRERKALENQLPAAPIVTASGGSGSKPIIALCMKCKEKREIANPERTVTKKGKSAVHGTCPVCGTKMFKLVKG